MCRDPYQGLPGNCWRITLTVEGGKLSGSYFSKAAGQNQTLSGRHRRKRRRADRVRLRRHAGPVGERAVRPTVGPGEGHLSAGRRTLMRDLPQLQSSTAEGIGVDGRCPVTCHSMSNARRAPRGKACMAAISNHPRRVGMKLARNSEWGFTGAISAFAGPSASVHLPRHAGRKLHMRPSCPTGGIRNGRRRSPDDNARRAARRHEGDPFGGLAPGAQVGKYEIVEMLGQGGFGITYRARDTQLHRDVAHQGIPADQLRHPPGRHHGAAALDPDGRGFPLGPRPLPRGGAHAGAARGRARHRHGPRFPRGQRHRLHGDDAGARRDAGGAAQARAAACSSRRSSSCSIPLLDGLEIVHEAGFLHRDIKPANILLDANGRPTLIDFGASRVALQGRTQAMTAVYHAGLCRLRAVHLGPAGSVDRHLCAGRHALSLRHRPPPPGALDRMHRGHAGAGGGGRQGPLCALAAGGDRCRPEAEGAGAAAEHRRLAARAVRPWAPAAPSESLGMPTRDMDDAADATHAGRAAGAKAAPPRPALGRRRHRGAGAGRRWRLAGAATAAGDRPSRRCAASRPKRAARPRWPQKLRQEEEARQRERRRGQRARPRRKRRARSPRKRPPPSRPRGARPRKPNASARRPRRRSGRPRRRPPARPPRRRPRSTPRRDARRRGRWRPAPKRGRRGTSQGRGRGARRSRGPTPAQQEEAARSGGGGKGRGRMRRPGARPRRKRAPAPKPTRAGASKKRRRATEQKARDKADARCAGRKAEDDAQAGRRTTGRRPKPMRSARPKPPRPRCVSRSRTASACRWR